MILPELLAIILVVAVCGLLMAGYPIALTLGGVSLISALAGHLLGVMDLSLLLALPQRVFGVLTNDVLLAIPLFVFMGVMLERSKIAEELLETMGRLFGSLTGGLAISVILVGVLLAAAKGVVGATVVTMGLITLPAMLRHGYDPRLAAGTVAATATLAQIMPPATVLVLLADQLNTAYQAAQLEQGIFAPNQMSVGDLFAGAIVPALSLVALYLLFQIAVAWLWPKACPAIPPDPAAPRGLALARRLAAVLVAPVLLILVVLGSILGGLATPTEAAGVGAFGAILLTALKLGRPGPPLLAVCALAAVLLLRGFVDLRLGRTDAGLATHLAIGAALILFAVAAFGAIQAIRAVDRAGMLRQTLAQTTHITTMIFAILIGATLFSLVFRGFGGDDMVHRGLDHLPGGPGAAILVVMVAMFLLGFVMDAFEIIFVVVPIVAPALLKLPGVDPVWLGLMMAVNLQTSYLHPPLGPTLFYLRGVAPPQITTLDIYVGVIPFVLIQMALLLALWFMPGLATWLPHRLYGDGAVTAVTGVFMKASDIFDLTGRVALVTGASSGLGARFAQVLAANGAKLVLVARRPDRIAALKAKIEADGGQAIAVEADVTDRAAMARAFDAAAAAFGTVTILINNAGVSHSTRALELAEEEWRRVLSTNLDAVFLNAQEAARRMLAANTKGAIVNIASVLGLGVSKGVIAYATAKAGVIQITKALALELAFKGVRVNAIAPGWFVTELNHAYLTSEPGRKITRDIPVGRFGQEGDLDGPLLLLVSDAGSYIAGATIVVDGGQMVALRG